MKSVHIILDHKTFKGGMAKYFKENFSEYNFDYIVYDKYKEKTNGFLKSPVHDVEYVNIWSPIKQIRFFKEITRKYDRVYLHSMFLHPLTRLYFGLMKKKDISKFVWIEWGYDIYQVPTPSLKVKMYSFFNKFIVKNFDAEIPYFVAISPMDIKQYTDVIKGKGKVFHAPYSGRSPENREKLVNGYKDKIKVSMNEKKEKKIPITIQLGHRADSFLNHRKWIDQLAKYEENNFEVLMPLSYGKKQYAQEVKEYAEMKLNGKCRFLTNVVSFDEYTEILDSVDILVLDVNRQIALGNIYPHIRNKKKIYMQSSGIMPDYFKENGVPVFDIENIGNISFDELTEDVDMETAAKFMMDLDLFDEKYAWNKVFTEVSGLGE